jgi:ABC-type uncharacterized transport system involved in gliding motility auxiliary subunit
MLVTDKNRWGQRLQGGVFVLLFLAVIGLCAWLSTRYSYTADWTATGRNTLSTASATLLQRMPETIHITAYATEDEALRQSIRDLIRRYLRVHPNIQLTFVNPDLVPDQVRELGIQVNGEMIVEYQDRQEHLKEHTEQGLSNLLQRLARADERWLVFLAGHGERKILGRANHDLGAFGNQLQKKGFQVHSQILSEEPTLPENTALLAIAGPQADLLPGEVAIIQDYLAQGGNLLWLHDPGKLYGLHPLADTLGIQFLPGMIVDPTTRALGISDPRFALVADYPAHAMTQQFDAVTLFPQACALKTTPADEWQQQPLMLTSAKSWLETGPLDGQIQFDKATDTPGPLTIGVALTRPHSEQIAGTDGTLSGEQRVIVMGDGDFLSNAYLGNGGNMDLGMNMINWLSHDDALMNIPSQTTPDRHLELSSLAQGVIGFGFLVALPLLFVAGGGFIWWQRRRR